MTVRGRRRSRCIVLCTVFWKGREMIRGCGEGQRKVDPAQMQGRHFKAPHSLEIRTDNRNGICGEKSCRGKTAISSTVHVAWKIRAGIKKRKLCPRPQLATIVVLCIGM